MYCVKQWDISKLVTESIYREKRESAQVKVAHGDKRNPFITDLCICNENLTIGQVTFILFKF